MVSACRWKNVALPLCFFVVCERMRLPKEKRQQWRQNKTKRFVCMHYMWVVWVKRAGMRFGYSGMREFFLILVFVHLHLFHLNTNTLPLYVCITHRSSACSLFVCANGSVVLIWKHVLRINKLIRTESGKYLHVSIYMIVKYVGLLY